ncbi:MAG: cystathionine beta-lyase [Rhodospirillaceae bacterium]|jgi:cysteine-S-conjugate beta-lyase|nr:cystathionine beta-lyase [Rhodospirillaceae bacterium]MBT4219721.1 cystathionine beta-lyase [Rhodospirillaceae bacterium]MBT4464647.1 cystathionine beta-lyase [Rhodospirillaceae bacterium]MBT5309786.1 cystathionine beta-lyase [Rhodospirillaceae bacterium]
MKKETKLLLAGRNPENNHGIVNPPVYHASTITYPTVADMEHASGTPYEGVRYGLRGTTTTFALEDAVTELEGGYRSIAVCSGLAAVTASLTAFLKTGDRVLMTDTVYDPTRHFCDSNLKRYGIDTHYYDPMIGAGIADLIDDNTRVIFLESPGSLTFEMQDVPAIVAAAKARGIITIMDNTWAAGYFFRPLEHGVDVSLQAGTKYIGGHSDLMMGTITTTEEAFTAVKRECSVIGLHAAPDDCYLALRGIRTLAARLARHQESALKIAQWMQGRDEVAQVLHPALTSCPGHDIWKRDFTGSSGLFSIVLDDRYEKAAVDAMLDGMELFPMGYSWGGYESLMIPADPTSIRTATNWTGGPLMRLHVGLEDTDDLIADLEKGFGRLNA